MPGANTQGDYFVDREEDMCAYDRLPSDVRQVLREAVFDFSALTVEKHVARYGRPIALRRIREIEVFTLTSGRVSTWGPEYPERK